MSLLKPSVLKQSVAFDVAKDQLDTCFSVIDTAQNVKVKATRKFANTPKGFREMEQWVKKHADASVPVVYTMEATGIYYEQLAWHLFSQKQAVAVVLPNKARQYAKSIGLKSKNDKIDSIGLARMGAQQNLPLWQPISKQLYRLRTLTRELESLRQQNTVVLNQLHALSYAQFEGKSTQKRLRSMGNLLEKQIEAIQKEIQQVVDADPALQRKIGQLTLIKGVGLVTAVTVIAETNGFTLFENHKQLISYAGYDVIENQSGKRVGKTRISKKGNSHIRRILHMAALNAVRYGEPVFQIFFDRLTSNGKMKMQAYVAVQKKLLVLLYTLCKKDTVYDPAYSGASAGKAASGDKESMPLFPVVSGGNLDDDLSGSGLQKEVALAGRATQDELPYDKSPEALFPVGQNY